MDPMAVSALAFTMYPVADLAASTAFYRDRLGLVPGALATEHWVEFEVAGATFGLGSFEQVGTPGTAQSLALEVTDLEGFRASLAQHGIASAEPFETPICRISQISDPDGNQIWLHEAKPA